MADFGDLSTDPADNTSIGGVNVGEGCPPANLNNAIRVLGAYGKALFDAVAALAAGMPVTGGTFTGNIFFTGRGAFLHHRDASLVTGPVDFLVEGSSRPTATEGAVVFYYAA